MNALFAGILNGINYLIPSYGWTMVIFTILMKLLVLPLNYKSRKSMRRMSELQPEISKLQTKYANDRQKMNMKMQALYSKYKVNPMSGCLPMVISMVILIIMFNAMREVANEKLASQTLELLATGNQTNESWLWIKNVWMPDTPFVPFVPHDTNSLAMITDTIWKNAFSKAPSEWLPVLEGMSITKDTINSANVFAALSANDVWKGLQDISMTIPTGLFGTWNVFKNNNGLLILPVLACVTQFLMSASQPQQPTANNSKGTGAFMKYFFPLLTLFFCFSYNAAFAIYWVVANIYAWIETIVLNKVLEKKDNEEAAVIEEDGIK